MIFETLTNVSSKTNLPSNLKEILAEFVSKFSFSIKKNKKNILINIYILI